MTRFSVILLCAILLSSASVGMADQPVLPENAERLTGEQIKRFLAGKTFRLVVYDAAKSLTGTSTWDSERGIAFGEYSWDRQPLKRWERRWWVDGDRNCTQASGGDVECQAIYVVGEQFYEIAEDGKLHAVSTPVR